MGVHSGWREVHKHGRAQAEEDSATRKTEKKSDIRELSKSLAWKGR